MNKFRWYCRRLQSVPYWWFSPPRCLNHPRERMLIYMNLFNKKSCYVIKIGKRRKVWRSSEKLCQSDDCLWTLRQSLWNHEQHCLGTLTVRISTYRERYVGHPLSTNRGPWYRTKKQLQVSQVACCKYYFKPTKMHLILNSTFCYLTDWIKCPNINTWNNFQLI